MEHITDVIIQDLYEKNFKCIDSSTFIIEDNEDYNPLVLIFYTKHDSIDIFNENQELLSVINFETWYTDWDCFKDFYWEIIDEYYNNVDNLCKKMAGL
jgi:hypothetical protein